MFWKMTATLHEPLVNATLSESILAEKTHSIWYAHEVWLARNSCCSPFFQRYIYLREGADKNINRCEFHLYQLYVFLICGLVFGFCPVFVFLIHRHDIIVSTNVGVGTSEYLLIPGFWIYFGILDVTTEIYKANVVSKFINFDKSKCDREQVKRFPMSEIYYVFCGYVAPVIIAFTPCILRKADGGECYSHSYGLFIIIWDAMVLELFIGLRLIRGCHILSYRISTGNVFAKNANQFWKNRDTFLSEEMVKEWSDEYLRRPYRAIQSITRRRAFFFTMMVAATLPTISLICLVVLPAESITHYPLLVQLLCIMVTFDLYVLLLIAQSAMCHAKWQHSVKELHRRLFDSKYADHRRKCDVGFADIFSIYVPVYNYWKSRFFGMRWVGVDMNWNLFFKLFSLLFVNAAVWSVKNNIAEKMQF